MFLEGKCILYLLHNWILTSYILLCILCGMVLLHGSATGVRFSMSCGLHKQIPNMGIIVTRRPNQSSIIVYYYWQERVILPMLTWYTSTCKQYWFTADTCSVGSVNLHKLKLNTPIMIYHTFHVFEIPLYISADVTQMGKRLNCNLKVTGSSPLCTTIFPQKMFACWHMSLQVKIHNQNDWRVTNQIEYTGLRQDYYL